jgi:cytochrome c oxidase subunit 2
MLLSLLADARGSFWMPKQASNFANTVDGLFNFVVWICVFFFVLIMVMMVWFAFKYRHKPGQEVSTHGGHSTALELTWTIIPTLLVLVIFYWGFKDFMDMTVDPPNAYEITATGQMWNWSFTYPNGVVSNDLHVPKDRPVRIVLQSSDVIHSLYVPVMRQKKDVVPGRYNRMWFVANELSPPEGFDVYCAEYCGTRHSMMLARCHVHEPAGFNKWLEDEANKIYLMKPTDLGELLYTRRGCSNCHSIDGSKIIGPSFKDAFGSNVPMADASSVLADESYIRESILYPQNKIHAGYQGVMPSFLGQLKDVEINGLIAYMKKLSVNYKGGDPNAGFGAPATGPTSAPATGPATLPAAPVAIR